MLPSGDVSLTVDGAAPPPRSCALRRTVRVPSSGFSSVSRASAEAQRNGVDPELLVGDAGAEADHHGIDERGAHLRALGGRGLPGQAAGGRAQVEELQAPVGRQAGVAGTGERLERAGDRGAAIRVARPIEVDGAEAGGCGGGRELLGREPLVLCQPIGRATVDRAVGPLQALRMQVPLEVVVVLDADHRAVLRIAHVRQLEDLRAGRESVLHRLGEVVVDLPGGGTAS